MKGRINAGTTQMQKKEKSESWYPKHNIVCKIIDAINTQIRLNKLVALL
jgi:hypothetical protein